jgi:hypothetical protein
MSLRRVVLPLPLRPRRTSVSPREMVRETLETMARPGISLMWKLTPRNSMAASEGPASFAFISIDSLTPEGEYRTPPSRLGAGFRRILLAEAASK